MNRKAILFTLIAGIIAAIIFVAVLWNRPPETVDDKKAMQMNAEVLTDAFLKNEQSANAAYLNKVIEVNGKIAEVSKNQDQKDVILLESSDPLSGVQCTMRDKGGNYKAGSTISIKGFCNGYTTVVLLSDCIVVP